MSQKRNDGKKCTNCGLPKPFADFAKNSTRKDGLQSQCKECQSAYYRNNRTETLARVTRYYRKHRDERLAYAAAYRAEHRDAILEKQRAYYRMHAKEYAEKSIVYREMHRDEILARIKRWRREHPDQLKANSHIWTQNRRARIANALGSYTYTEFEELCHKANNRCLCCGQVRPLTADHIIPLSCGGANFIDNIQPLCQPCNSRKSSKIIDYRNGNTYHD